MDIIGKHAGNVQAWMRTRGYQYGILGANAIAAHRTVAPLIEAGVWKGLDATANVAHYINSMKSAAVNRLHAPGITQAHPGRMFLKGRGDMSNIRPLTQEQKDSINLLDEVMRVRGVSFEGRYWATTNLLTSYMKRPAAKRLPPGEKLRNKPLMDFDSLEEARQYGKV
jgi:hypothetical protein